MVAVSLKKNFFKQKTAYEISVCVTGVQTCALPIYEIEVITEASGQPILVLHGETKKRFDQKFHLGQIEISLTHESPLALANVLIQYERDGSNV